MYDPDDHKTIESLIEKVGSKEECLRLGFIDKDDNETLYISTAGLGYLLHVVARDVNSLAEAYAAGFDAAYEEMAEYGSITDTE